MGEEESLYTLISVLIRVVPSFCQLSTDNCQLSTVNFPLLFHGMSFVESFEALLVAHKPPVPRLVTDALAVVFGEGHFKAEGGGVGF